MLIVRRLGKWFLGALFLGALWLFLLLSPLSFKLSNPDTVKRWVAVSGIYGDLLPQVLEQAAEKGTDDQIEPEQANDNPVDPKVIQDLFAEVLPPAKLQEYIETVIDGSYGWLQGKTEIPQFSIDLSERRPAIIAAFTDYVHEKLAGAPTCSLSVVDQPDFDPLSANCIPPGYSVAQVAEEAVAELTGPDGLLEEPVLTSQTLINNLRQQYQESPEEAINPDTVLDVGPRAYGHLTKLPWYLVGLVLVTGAGLIWLSRDRMKTGRGLAIKLLIAGGVITLATYIASRVFSSLIDRIDIEVAERTVNLNKTLQPLYETILRELSQAIYWFAVPTLIAGLGGTIALTVLIRRRETARHPAPILPENPPSSDDQLQ